MSRKTVSAVMLALLVASVLVLAVKIQPVKAEGTTIIINADGSITPPTGLISTVDNIAYTFTGNVNYPTYNGIVIERSNIVVDGNGYTLQGNYGYSLTGAGLNLTGISGVTIKNTAIEGFGYGILLDDSSNDAINGNKVTYCSIGIRLEGSSGNTISGNSVTHDEAGAGEGISLDLSPNNTLRNNTMANNWNNFGVGGVSAVLSWFVNDVDASNTVNGKPVYYWVDMQNMTVPSDAGYVALVNCVGITVQNLTITNNDQGILLEYTTSSTIANNNIMNAHGGIILEQSSGNIISGNNVSYVEEAPGFGISLDLSPNNILRNNTMANNWVNFGVSGSELSDFVNDVDASNTVNGKPVYYWVDMQNMTVPSDAGYVALVNCEGITVQGLNLTNNEQGVLLEHTTGSNVTNNILTYAYTANIYLEYSSSNIISGNNITLAQNGVADGILLSSSSGNIIFGNNITNNGDGVVLSSSSGNLIYHNNFTGNHQQVLLSGRGLTNVWDDGYPAGGNYWSDYNGTDLFSGPYQNVTGSDGIGDTPYVIDANSTDNYPLMNPYSPSSLSITKTVIGQGFALSMYFAGPNYDNYPETFNVTVYANTTYVASQNVTLLTRNSNVTFTWNTTGFAYGNYTLWAFAANDNCKAGNIILTIPGDINGDFKVTLADLVLLANAYGSKPADAKWNSNADINGNGAVDLSDLVLLANHYGQHYP